MIYFLFLLISMFITSCSSDDSTSGPCITALDCAYGQICVDGVCTEDTGNTGNTGDTGDTGNTGNTVDTGDTTDTGNTSDSGNSGNSGDSDDTSDDTGDPDSFDTDTADDIDDTDAGPDDDTNDEDIPEPVCGDGKKEGIEQCDNGAELNGQTKCAYGETSCTVCTASCNEESGITSYCGDGIEADKEAVFSGEIVRFYLEDATGLIATDSSGTGNNGTVAGASWVDAKFGKGLQLNGTAENYISLAYTPPVNNFTVSAWFKTEATHEIDPEADNNTTGTSGQNYIFGADNKDTEGGAGVSIGTNGISVYEHGNSYMPALAVYNGTVGNGWNHFAVTYTDRQPRIYLNGILVRTGLVSPKTTVHAPTIIGAGPYGYFNGTLDHVRIFDRPLSAEEIIAAMGEKCDDGALNGTQGKCKTDCSGYDCTPGTFTFDYSGAQQTFTVPSGSGTYTIEAWGAQGQKNSAGAVAGGLGGYSKADVSVSAGDILYIFVGGGGGTGPAAGWNGGGAGGTGLKVADPVPEAEAEADITEEEEEAHTSLLILQKVEVRLPAEVQETVTSAIPEHRECPE